MSPGPARRASPHVGTRRAATRALPHTPVHAGRHAPLQSPVGPLAPGAASPTRGPREADAHPRSHVPGHEPRPWGKMPRELAPSAGSWEARPRQGCRSWALSPPAPVGTGASPGCVPGPRSTPGAKQAGALQGALRGSDQGMRVGDTPTPHGERHIVQRCTLSPCVAPCPPQPSRLPTAPGRCQKQQEQGRGPRDSGDTGPQAIQGGSKGGGRPQGCRRPKG